MHAQPVPRLHQPARPAQFPQDRPSPTRAMGWPGRANAAALVGIAAALAAERLLAFR